MFRRAFGAMRRYWPVFAIYVLIIAALNFTIVGHSTAVVEEEVVTERIPWWNYFMSFAMSVAALVVYTTI